MTLEMTPALELALDRARRFAANDGAAEAGPRHLLRGLVAEDEGKAVALLIAAGTDWPRLQAHLGLPAIDTAIDVAHIMPHGSIRAILGSAGVIARHHGDEGSIATDHVLLAMLTNEQDLRDELAGFGMDYDRLRQGVVGVMELIHLDEPLVLTDPVEETQTARILDASANRAREALRVLEDYTRFALADAFLSGQLKRLRHDLAQALGQLPASLLLESRDTPHDVGTAISTEREWERSSPQAVVQANAKRLQEALRSLEEYGKVLKADFARAIEKIRYQSYTLEPALVRGGAARQQLADARLYVLVTSASCRASLVGTIKEAALGGAQIIQLREKGIDDRTLLARARDVRQLTRSCGVLFIVNDRPDIARLSEADGVHLGQDDMPTREARRLLGPDALIGVSTHNLEQVGQAILDGANYIGVGPTFPSQTKAFNEFAGLEFVCEALAQTSLPAFAIGGIDLGNVEQVLAVGARRVAVSQAVCAAKDPRAAALRMRKRLG